MPIFIISKITRYQFPGFSATPVSIAAFLMASTTVRIEHAGYNVTGV